MPLFYVTIKIDFHNFYIYVMKTIKNLLLLLWCLCTTGIAYSQKKVAVERKQKFDDNWMFHLGDDARASQPDFDDSQWRKVDLPHDWSIEGKVDKNNPMGNDGGYYPSGIGWYRKTFDIPADHHGKKLNLYFEGVYMNAEVFINGVSLGIRPYGYSSFFHEITAYIKPGKKNIVAVRVDNAQQKNSRWYSGSGIYRHVWLIATDPLHIAPWGVSVSTPEVANDKASVKVVTLIKNETGSQQTFTLVTALQDSAKNVGSKEQQVRIPAQSQREIVQTISVTGPKLWHPNSPNLYQASVSIVKNKKQVDLQSVHFGIRSIAYSAEDGFLLNGKGIKLNGGCVHHDNGALGAASYDRAEYRKAELLKAAGFNAVRTSHNPPSEAFLDACDRLGLIVMDEAFDGWREQKTKYDYAMLFDQWWQKDIEALVIRDRNHPSILFWSIGNEIIERKKAEAVETADKLAKLVRKLDPTRPVTSAITTWDSDWEIFDPLFKVHDIGGYNYQMHRAVSDHKRVPGRVIVQTESYPRDAFENWKAVNDHKYIIGDFVWTAMDYLGESGIGRYFYKGETEGQHYERDIFPWHGAYCGDIDLTGWRKPISHYRDLLYNEDKKLYMAVREPSGYYGEIKETLWSVWPTWESWTWPGHEGKDIEVEIYSRYPVVRLYLNGKKICDQPVSVETKFKAVFKIPYVEGVLKAVGIENGKEVEESILTTSGKPSGIRLKADRNKIAANGQDLSFITVEITDEKGNIAANAKNQLAFKVEGAGKIVAVSNADLQDQYPYILNTRKAWKGRAMVIVKSQQKKGSIKITVSSEGLRDASQAIVVE